MARLSDEAGRAIALVAELLHPPVGRADERELGGDEQGVQRNEHGDAEQEQDLGHLATACLRGQGCEALCLPTSRGIVVAHAVTRRM